MPVERPEREQKPIPPFALFEAISGQDSVLLQDALGFAPLWECFSLLGVSEVPKHLKTRYTPEKRDGSQLVWNCGATSQSQIAIIVVISDLRCAKFTRGGVGGGSCST